MAYLLPTAIFLVAAILEVSGDAAMRQQVRGGAWWWALVGFAALSAYGWLVNHVPWHFSKLLGAYVAVFAWIGVLWGKFFYGETVAPATWIGLAIISIGGAVIQLGALAK